jgi:hypothetical protein
MEPTRRRRPHPARRARRTVGWASAGGLLAMSGWMAIDASNAATVATSTTPAVPQTTSPTATTPAAAATTPTTAARPAQPLAAPRTASHGS